MSKPSRSKRNNRAVVLIDSQGDCLRDLSRHQCFHPDLSDRLALVNLADSSTLALNLFQADRVVLNSLKGKEREDYHTAVTSSFEYICNGLLAAELTSQMTVVTRYTCMLLFEIPNATIRTFIELLQDVSPFLQYVNRLSPTAQDFISQIYDEKSSYARTRQSILTRLYHIMSNPTFERIFSQPESKFNMAEALNTGKVVLINTDKAGLQAEWSSILGRYFIAQIMQATYARASIPPEERTLALIFCDEASEILDKNIEQLLNQGRKYSVALHLFTQTMQQWSEAGIRATALSAPALRYTGSLNDSDANLLAKEMNTSAEFLKGVRKTATSAEWSLYVRNLLPAATRITVPYFQAERAPKMPEEAYQRLLQRNRERLCVPHSPSQASTLPSPKNPSNDGDQY